MRPSRILVAVVAAVALVLASCGGGDGGGTTAPAGRDETHDVSVMTRNLYLGADLMPLFESTANTLAATARATYDQVTSSEVDARMDAVAREIVDNRPDLVALQEATWWRQQAAGAAEPSDLYDFVKLLLGHLAERGATYTVASSVDGFSGGLPIQGVGTVTMQDRDVIIVRDGSGVTVANPTSGTFADRMTAKISGAPIEVVRGWTSIDATVGDRTFRLFATHLEAFDDPVRDAQEKELLGILDAAGGPTMLLGDLNSASTGKDSTAYRNALAAGLKDVWPAVNGKAPGLTCCRSADLKSGRLSARIDYILHRGGFDPVSAEVVGTDAMSRTPGNRWASDHAGVVATLEVPAA